MKNIIGGRAPQTPASGFEEAAYKRIDEAEAAAKDAIDALEDRAKSRVHILNTAYRNLSDATHKMRDWAHQVEAEAIAKKRKVEGKIKARPVVSASVAFGIGLTLAALLLGRKHHEEE